MNVSSGREIMRSLTDGRNINRYKKKQLIYSEGNRPVELYFLQKGKVKTFKTNDFGKDLAMDLFSEGDFLGHVALMEGSGYKESSMAMEDTELAVIPKKDFDELMNNSREIAQKFVQLLAKSVADKEAQLLGMAYNSLRKKVAEALVAVRKKYTSSTSVNFTIDISRDNLATIAGTATESLIRTLGDFRDEKLIEIKEGAIVILQEKNWRTYWRETIRPLTLHLYIFS